MQLSFRTSIYLPFIALTLALVSLASFAFPMYVIRPFRHQGATELDLALFVKQIAPWFTILCAVIGLAIVLFRWRRLGGWISRATTVFSLVIMIAAGYLARVNVYEDLMFHPLGAPQFESIQQAHLDKDDMLLSVSLNGVSRAYPIREMAYHHVVNDWVGGEPIAATY